LELLDLVHYLLIGIRFPLFSQEFSGFLQIGDRLLSLFELLVSLCANVVGSSILRVKRDRSMGIFNSPLVIA